jgi:hypothetical protein
MFVKLWSSYSGAIICSVLLSSQDSENSVPLFAFTPRRFCDLKIEAEYSLFRKLTQCQISDEPPQDLAPSSAPKFLAAPQLPANRRLQPFTEKDNQRELLGSDIS